MSPCGRIEFRGALEPRSVAVTAAALSGLRETVALRHAVGPR
jgi:hypothetical protein